MRTDNTDVRTLLSSCYRASASIVPERSMIRLAEKPSGASTTYVLEYLWGYLLQYARLLCGVTGTGRDWPCMVHIGGGE